MQHRSSFTKVDKTTAHRSTFCKAKEKVSFFLNKKHTCTHTWWRTEWRRKRKITLHLKSFESSICNHSYAVIISKPSGWVWMCSISAAPPPHGSHTNICNSVLTHTDIHALIYLDAVIRLMISHGYLKVWKRDWRRRVEKRKSGRVSLCEQCALISVGRNAICESVWCLNRDSHWRVRAHTRQKTHAYAQRRVRALSRRQRLGEWRRKEDLSDTGRLSHCF